MQAHYKLEIMTKPYIAKFLHSMYGCPLIFSTSNFLGTSLLGYLTTRVWLQRDVKKIEKRCFDEFTTPLTLLLPKRWLYTYEFKTNIEPANLLYLNKHFENLFTEHLVHHTWLLHRVGVDVADAIRDFCTMHAIELDEDMGEYAIQKKELRLRNEWLQRMEQGKVRIRETQLTMIL